MTTLEKRATFSLASIFAFRMLGLFMILPVFSLYANQITGATPFLMGVALGIYGLTQACLQIPFGMLSDRIGRKPVIAIGLLLFAIGSSIAALSHTMTGIIIGRAIQGAGAIGSTIIATVADLTSDTQRTKAMAVIGMVIGLAFSFAIVLGPVINGWIHLYGIFWLTTALALTGILILFTVVPTPTRQIIQREAQPVPALFKAVLTQIELLRLDFGIFSLHAILTASFIALPIALQRLAGLNEQQQWYFYLPILALSFIAMLPFIIIGEKKRKLRKMFLGAIVTVAIGQAILYLNHQSLFELALALFIFFAGFNLLEASLPSLISKLAPAGSKGTAMGVYSASQFLGIFFGGCVGGYLFGHHHVAGVFLFCVILAVIWLIIARGMHPVSHLGTKVLQFASLNSQQALDLTEKLLTIRGVADVNIVTADGVAYLKVDNAIIDKDALENIKQRETGE